MKTGFNVTASFDVDMSSMDENQKTAFKAAMTAAMPEEFVIISLMEDTMTVVIRVKNTSAKETESLLQTVTARYTEIIMAIAGLRFSRWTK